MLVLTRRAGEKLIIGNEIIIEILSVSGEGVRLGVVAPRETSVHRFEIFTEIQRANCDAAAHAADNARSSLTTLAAQLRQRKANLESEV
jgi:carbon storage regulator